MLNECMLASFEDAGRIVNEVRIYRTEADKDDVRWLSIARYCDGSGQHDKKVHP